LDPLPAEWTNGKKVRIEDAGEDMPEPDQNPDAVDKWYRELEEAVAEIDPSDYEIIERAFKENDEIEKARMRQEMGL
jgi:hypothetical protein